jgi:HAMP domain-containing protein
MERVYARCILHTRGIMSAIEENSPEIVWHRRIGNRIVLVAIISAVVPLLLLGATIAAKVRSDLLRQTVATQKTITATLLHGIASLFENYRRQIETVSSMPAVQSMQLSQQLPVIHEFLEQQKVFFGCRIYDATGRAVLIAVRNQKDESREKNAEALDLDAAAGLGKTAALVIKDKKAALYANDAVDAHEKMLYLLAPIFDFVDPTMVTGVISCSISISSPDIHEIISAFPIDADDILLLLDRNGNVISSQGPLPEGLRGIKTGSDSFAEPQSIEISIGSTRYLGVIAPVPGSEGLLLVARPAHLVLEFLNHLLFDLLLMIVVAFVLAIAAGFFMSRSMAEAISSLIKAIRNVSSGMVSHRVEVRGEDELAEASMALNEMLNTLEKHRIMDDVWSREWENARQTSRPDSSQT